jgi:hypothetical protein
MKTTGMIGIATGQTARLNLLNPGVQVVPAGLTCTASVTFYDGNGTVRKIETVTVAPGTSQFVDIHSDTDLSLAADSRLEIRAVTSIPAVPPPSSAASGTPPTPACQLIHTLEVFDDISMRTQAVLGHADSIN